MKKMVLILCLGLIGPIGSAAAPSGQGFARVRKRFGEVLARKGMRNVRSGIFVIRLDDHRVVFARNARTPLIPASNQKLVISLAALTKLGKNYQYRTLLARRGKDLLLIGAGDPATGDEILAKRRGEDRFAFMDRWAKRLRKKNQTQFDTLIVRDGVFDRQLVHPHWDRRQLHKWYEAPVAALNFNDNCLEITVKGAQPGRPVELVDIFPPGFATIDNTCITKGKSPALWLTRKPGKSRIILKGSCPSGRTTRGLVTVHDPAKLFAAILRQRLEKNGIQITGKTIFDHRFRNNKENSLEILTEHRTPLADVLDRCNRRSQNLFAECLLKTLGRLPVLRGGADRQGTWKNGGQTVETWLTGLGLDSKQFHIDDGGGMSRENRLSAFVIGYLLLWADRQPFAETFRESLSVAGVNGTLRRRFRGTFYQGRVIGKSGYLRGVVALSGYVRCRSGRRIAFSFLMNATSGRHPSLRTIQNTLCKILIDEL